MLPYGIVLFPHLQTMEVLSLASVETASCAAVVVGQKRVVLVVLLPPLISLSLPALPLPWTVDSLFFTLDS